MTVSYRLLRLVHWRPRGVIRDVGRVMDLPYAQVDTIAKMIPQELNITIDKALQMNPELKKVYEDQKEIHDLIDTAKRLEGLPQTYIHACGWCRDQPEGCFMSMCRFLGHPTVRSLHSLR